MARPKLGETETERMQLKITTAEIEAIDDWRFANRIQSRSEAVRRLCQIGVGLDEELEESVRHADHLRLAARYKWEADLQLLRANKDHPNSEYVESLNNELQISHDILERADDLYLLLVSTWNRIVPLIDGKDFKSAVDGSREAQEAAHKIFREMNRRERQIQENAVIMKVHETQTPEEAAAYEALSEDEKDAWWEKKMIDELGPFEEDDE